MVGIELVYIIYVYGDFNKPENTVKSPSTITLDDNSASFVTYISAPKLPGYLALGLKKIYLYTRE